MSRVVFAVLMFVVASSACAQVIYAPVQYQFGREGARYYYGGQSPLVHAWANAEGRESGWGRSNGYAFHSGNITTHREVTTEPARVLTDGIPYDNGTFYGYTDGDARNAAYANSATYFRKADVARMAVPQADGTWVVPATGSIAPGSILIRPYVAPVKVVAEPKPIMIIPKRLLDKPLWPSNNPQADIR